MRVGSDARRRTGMSEIGDTVEPDDARVLLGRGEAHAIDLRAEEVAAEGHAPGAAIIGDRSLAEVAEEIREGREVPLLVFCEDGERSGEAAAELREQGIEAAAVEGGWSEWLSSGMPTQPRSDDEYEGPKQSIPGQ
jgi:rhodanese-related sulfurtransferase